MTLGGPGVSWQLDTSDGGRYLATIKHHDPKKYVNEQLGDGLPIKLNDVRQLITQQQPNMQGKIVVGVSVLVALINIDMFPGPVPVMHVCPSAWYFPSENERTRKKIEALISAAERNELKNSAADAGIQLP